MAGIDLRKFMNNFAQPQMFTAKGAYNANIIRHTLKAVKEYCTISNCSCRTTFANEYSTKYG